MGCNSEAQSWLINCGQTLRGCGVHRPRRPIQPRAIRGTRGSAQTTEAGNQVAHTPLPGHPSGISKLTTHTAHTGAHHAHRRTPRTPRTPAHTTHTEVIGGPKYVYTYERLARRFRSAGVATYMLAVSACTSSCFIVINYVKIIIQNAARFRTRGIAGTSCSTAQSPQASA